VWGQRCGVKILLASSEISPFAKTGGLGDVAEALPIALNKVGIETSAIIPLYGLVRKNGFNPKLVKEKIPLNMGGKGYTFDLLVEEHKGVKFFFIGNDPLYARDGLYGTPKGDHQDNAIRFGLFSRAVIETLPYIGNADIIHCNDWQTALIPLYLKNTLKADPKLKGIKTLFSIHNMAYQGLFGREALSQVDIPKEIFTPRGVEWYGKVGFLKAGIVYSDAISTVSKGYAAEILTSGYGCGLEKIMKTREKDLYGIVNGADYTTWHPEDDKFIAKRYSANDLTGKLECKRDLVKEFNIPFDDKKPLVGMITRLAYQKGIDIVMAAMDGLLELGANFVILGTGDEKYNDLCRKMSERYKGKAQARVDFDNALAHKIEAGCDIFLMPSRYEPCGLNQMYSMKYATVPVVRATGGLRDTVEDFDPKTGRGNGFTFKRADSEDMLTALGRAIGAFSDKKVWRTIQRNGLVCDFSWEQSAKNYLEVYTGLLRERD